MGCLNLGSLWAGRTIAGTALIPYVPCHADDQKDREPASVGAQTDVQIDVRVKVSNLSTFFEVLEVLERF